MNYSVAAELAHGFKDKLSLSSEKGLCAQDTAEPNKNIFNPLAP